MFQELDQTLAAFLKQELPAELGSRVTISFVPPDGSFPPANAAYPVLNLYLYDVRENTDQRTNEIRTDRQADGTLVQTPPPVRVDCAYLVTAWCSPGAPDSSSNEHTLLGEAMSVLLAHPYLPELPDHAAAAAFVAAPAKVLPPAGSLSVSSVAQMLGGRHKLSLNYVVTVDVQTQPVTRPPFVTDKVLKWKPIPRTAQ